MKVCPSCREEFLEHISKCSGCDQVLVFEHELDDSGTHVTFSKEEFLASETVVLLEGAMAQCRELERLLLKTNIPSIIYPAHLNCDSSQTLGTTCEMKYLLLIKETDMELAKAALQGRFSELVMKEGQGQMVVESVNLDDEIITCPACGEQNQLLKGECPSCGLSLGIPEGVG